MIESGSSSLCILAPSPLDWEVRTSLVRTSLSRSETHPKKNPATGVFDNYYYHNFVIAISSIEISHVSAVLRGNQGLMVQILGRGWSSTNPRGETYAYKGTWFLARLSTPASGKCGARRTTTQYVQELFTYLVIQGAGQPRFSVDVAGNGWLVSEH